MDLGSGQPQQADSDRALVARARSGDRAAFGSLMAAHLPRIHRLASHLTGSRIDADDVAQETFVRAWRALPNFDGRAEFSTWIYRICVNTAISFRRSGRRHKPDADPRLEDLPSEGTSPDPERSAADREAYGKLAAAIDGLSESLRVTLVLATVEGLPYDQIAATLGCSEGTVAWRVHEARKQLLVRLTPATSVPARAASEGRGRRRHG